MSLQKLDAQIHQHDESLPKQQEKEQEQKEHHISTLQQKQLSIGKKSDVKLQQQQNQLNKSTSRQKQSVYLPFISNQSNYGDRIFDKKSASTLQKTILVYSIPKANRFNNGPKYNGQPSYCIDTCFKPNPSKGAGFGFGRKKQFPDWMQKNMKQNPPPGAYFDTKTEGRIKGPTFGISHKFYEKVFIPKQKYSTLQPNKSSLHLYKGLPYTSNR